MQAIVPAFLFGFIALILFGIAAWLLVPGVRELRQALASRSWPSTPGKIVSADVVDVAPVNTDMDSRHRESYRPVIEYAYEVNGKSYRANHRVFGDESISYGSQSKAEAIIADYPPEQVVQVYYDPANPATAALLPGRIGAVMSALVAGVICLAIGLLLAWASVAVVLAQQPQ